MKDKRGNKVRRRSPIEWAYREMIIFPVVNSKLEFKVIKRIERMSSIKVFIIFSMRTFSFTVVTRSIGTNLTSI